MPDKKPFYSIIIPAYNCAERLGHALSSIKNQSFKDFEVIVCDDGSTDNTKQVADSFANVFDIKYLWQEHWGGPARPKNNGLKIAKGDYIAFLDSDDWWYPKKLETVKRYIHNSDIIYHDLDIYTPRGKKVFKKVKGRHLKKPIFIDLMKNENALINSSVTVRKSIVEQAGGLTEGFLTCVEDFDLWLKISRITEKFTYIPKALGAYWINSGNVSEPSERVIKRLEFVYHRYFPFLKNTDREQAELLMAYLIGRIKQKMGLLKEALELFKKSVKSKNIKIRIRSLCWLIILGIKNKYKNHRI